MPRRCPSAPRQAPRAAGRQATRAAGARVVSVVAAVRLARHKRHLVQRAVASYRTENVFIHPAIRQHIRGGGRATRRALHTFRRLGALDSAVPAVHSRRTRITARRTRRCLKMTHRAEITAQRTHRTLEPARNACNAAQLTLRVLVPARRARNTSQALLRRRKHRYIATLSKTTRHAC